LLFLVLISTALIALTIVVHGFGMMAWIGHLVRNFARDDGTFEAKKRLPILIATAIVLTFLHLVEILAWAIAYKIVAPGELDSLETAMYFSAVTFNTVGYGDITLSGDWRLLSGLEAINGILLIGWSTAFLFAVIQRTWSTGDRQSSQQKASKP
jgi:hypothetical protein